MAEPAYVASVAAREPDAPHVPRHSAVVRVTHWITTASFVGLLVSGVAILVAHPRLYWGETGAFGGPSLLDLPIPFILGHSGWGRSLHFLSAWICVLTGLVYVLDGVFSGHFRRDLLPRRADVTPNGILRSVSGPLQWKRWAEEKSHSYNSLQRLAYVGVVFILLPLIVVTGLAMSPAITAAIPAVVEILGGQQSARTIHFFASVLLVVFTVVHVAMVCVTGFTSRTREMIRGRSATARETL